LIILVMIKSLFNKNGSVRMVQKKRCNFKIKLNKIFQTVNLVKIM